jgi:GTP pyrophosphokinase
MVIQLSDKNSKQLKVLLFKTAEDLDINLKLIKKAVSLAEKYYKDKERLNGEPFINHSLAVAVKTAEMRLGANSISAAIVHDLLENYPYEDYEEMAQEIEEKLGKRVLKLVKALTKLNSTPAEKSKLTEVQAAQKYLLATVKDLRVIMIKLADKFHNVMTIEGLDKSDQEKYLKEVEKIYLPLTEYLGLGQIRRELRKLVFEKSHPEEYKQIQDYLKNSLKINEDYCKKIQEELETICSLKNIPAKISGRRKPAASVYKKRKKYLDEGKGTSIDNMEDLFAFRILVNTQQQCYDAASLVANFFEKIEGSLDDYIQMPKKNGYKSLQISFKHPEYGVFELQIQTHEMHECNEYGTASHIAYKFANKRQADPSAAYAWVKEVHDKRDNYSPQSDQPIKLSLFEDVVFVLTPDKDIVELPKGSTPIDLAYWIHTQLGHQCIGAQVNGKSVPLKTKLKTGDIVKLKTNDQRKYADKQWLNWVRTSKARNAIERSLKRKEQNL